MLSVIDEIWYRYVVKLTEINVWKTKEFTSIMRSAGFPGFRDNKPQGSYAEFLMKEVLDSEKPIPYHKFKSKKSIDFLVGDLYDIPLEMKATDYKEKILQLNAVDLFDETFDKYGFIYCMDVIIIKSEREDDMELTDWISDQFNEGQKSDYQKKGVREGRDHYRRYGRFDAIGVKLYKFDECFSGNSDFSFYQCGYKNSNGNIRLDKYKIPVSLADEKYLVKSVLIDGSGSVSIMDMVKNHFIAEQPLHTDRYIKNLIINAGHGGILCDILQTYYDEYRSNIDNSIFKSDYNGNNKYLSLEEEIGYTKVNLVEVSKLLKTRDRRHVVFRKKGSGVLLR